jgi:predicted Zn-ribbon and HTH transcriptional regulator
VKYAEAYLAALYDVLEAGGKQDAIDKAINEVNRPTAEGLAHWLKAFPKQPCDQCGTEFEPQDVTLDQEMSCPTCKKTAPT